MNHSRRLALLICSPLVAAALTASAAAAEPLPGRAAPETAGAAAASGGESEHLRFVRQFRPDVLDENPQIRERTTRYWYFLTYPTGELPDRPWDRAREHVERHVPDAAPWPLVGAPLQVQPPADGVRSVAAAALVAPGANVWVEYGPKPLDSTGTTNNAYQYGITSGRLNVIISDPVDRGAGKGDRAWLGFASGGLWRLDGIRSVTCAGGTCDTSGVSAVSLWDDKDLTTQAISAIELDLASDPSGNTLYVGTGDWQANDQFSAGIMKTTDGGATWTQLGADIFTPYSKVLPPSQANGGCVGCRGNRWNNQNIKAIEVDPKNPATVLVGTRYDLYISHDSGATWQICRFGTFQTDPEATGGAINGINRVSGIHLDATGAQTRAYVAVGYLVNRDTDSNGTFDNANNGVYSFLVPSSGCPAWPAGYTAHLDGLPSGTGTTAGGSAATGRIELAGVGGGSGLTLYAQIQDATNLDAEGTWVLRPNDASWADGDADGLKDWRLLSNSGATAYKDCSNQSATTAQDWYDLHAVVHPTNHRLLYLGHVDLFKANVDAGYTQLDLSSSSNLTNVYRTSCSSYGKVHPDQHSFAFVELGAADPNYGNWILVGNDGGIYLNTNAGAVDNWARLSAAGISTNQFYAGQVGMNFAGTDANANGTLEASEYGNPVDARQWLLGGMQDNGCASWDSGTTGAQWTARGRGGDGMWTAFDSLGGTLVGGYWIVESQNGNLACSSTGVDGPFSGCSPGWQAGESQDWSTPIVMDQFHCTDTQCRHAFTAGDYVYASTAYGTPSWTRVSPLLPSSTSAGSVVSLNVFPGPASAASAVAGTDDGKWWRSVNVLTCSGSANTSGFSCSANGSASWLQISSTTNQAPSCGSSSEPCSEAFPNRVVAGVAYHPTDNRIVYAAMSGFGANTAAAPGHLYQATFCDSGAAVIQEVACTGAVAGKFVLKDKSGNLPDVPFQTVAVNPHNPKQVFAGSLWGFYFTDDVTVASPTWYRYMEGPLPNAPIFHFSLDRGPQGNPFASTVLSAFTYGRGVYAIKLPAAGESFCVSKPFAPTGVAAASSAANRIEVTWNDSATPGVTEYRVYRSTTSGGPYTPIATVADTSPGSGGSGTYAYADAAVSGGSTYHYVVRSYNGKCESPDSAQAQATATGDCTLSPSFSGLQSVVQLGGGQGCGLRLSWNAGTSQCGGGLVYNVYRSTSGGFTPDASTLHRACVAGTTFDDTATSVGTSYHYVVRAEDGGGKGPGPCGGGSVDSNAVQRSGAAGLYTWTAGAEAGDPGLTLGAPWSASTARKRSGAASYFSGYANNLCAAVTTPSLQLAAGTTSQLSFWTAYQLEVANNGNAWDGGVVEISSNGGAWTQLALAGGYPTKFLNNTGDACGYGAIGCFAGNSLSFTQYSADLSSYAGQMVQLRWRLSTDGAVTQEGWYVDDIAVTNVGAACSAAPQPVAFLTATGKDAQLTAEWLNPASYVGPTRVCRGTGAFASDPASSSCPPTAGVDEPGTAGAADAATFSALANGQTQYLSAFVSNGNATPVYSGRKTVTGHPMATSGNAKWNFSTGAAALAAPIQWSGVGVYAASNDRAVYAMSGGAGGGTWPAGWKPVAMNGPAQWQPLVLPASVSGLAFDAVFVSSQDGYVYCFRTADGSACPGWTAGRSSYGGAVPERLQANVMLYQASVVADRLLLVGTRNRGSGNALIALRLGDGVEAWRFTNAVGQGASADGAAIGIVSAPAFVDAAAARAYFTSRARAAPGGSSHTVWAVDFGTGSPVRAWAHAIGDVDGSFTRDYASGRMLVGTNGGAVHSLDPATGVSAWSRSFGDGPVKTFVYYSSGNARLYFATTGKVWSIPASGATGSDWSVDLIAPSRPLLHFGTSRTYVGACSDATCANGRLVELDSANAWATPKSYDLAGAGGLGPVIIDRGQSPALAHMGSRSGRVYAVQIPLP